MRGGPYYWAGMCAVLSFVAEPTESALAESVRAGRITELSGPMVTTESLTA